MGPGLKSVLLASLLAGLVVHARAGCAPYWTQYNGHCYRLFGDYVHWDQANRHCRDLGSELTSVHSAGEHIFLFNLWDSAAKPECRVEQRGYWMGLNDIEQEGTFVWSDGTNVDFLNFHRLQPDNSGTGEDCVNLWYSLTADNEHNNYWNDAPCEISAPYICKMHLI